VLGYQRFEGLRCFHLQDEENQDLNLYRHASLKSEYIIAVVNDLLLLAPSCHPLILKNNHASFPRKRYLTSNILLRNYF
jgi:hypothetical protein